MATATPPDLNANLIESIAAGRLGPAPAAAGDPPAGAPAGDPAGGGQAAPQNPKPAADPTPTAMEKAQAKVAPNQEGSMSDEEAIKFVKIGDREYSEAQLTGTLDRHSKLNYRWQTEVAPVAPVLDVVRKMMASAKEAGVDVKAEDMAKLVDSAVRAYVKDPQMGGDSKQKTPGSTDGKPPMSDAGGGLGDNDDDTYSKWEKENAVSLPPGFKETAKTAREMSQKVDQLLNLFQTLAQGGAAGQTASAEADAKLNQARGLQSQAATEMIKNNLNGAFTVLQLPLDPESRADFRMFAAQRGYDFPDFMDPEMARTVAADYKANKEAPEMARLREIAKKRQAFTGMVEGAPGGAAGGAKPAGDPMLAGLVDAAMTNRRMG
jgi:hypothetical protein